MPDARERASGRVLVGTMLAAVLAAVLAVGPGSLVAAEGADHKPWGRLRAPDQTLVDGCSEYFFRYRVKPPRDEWLAEMFVRSPEGVNVYHTAQDSEFHKNRGKIRFPLCKASTSYGRHKLRMKITWYENDPAHTEHEGWVKPSYFRMTRP